MAVHLIASFSALPGAEQAVRELIADYAADVAAEPGNLRFDVYVDRDDATAFTVVEAYADQAAFDAHLTDEKNAAFNAALGPLAAGGGSTLRFLEPVTP